MNDISRSIGRPADSRHRVQSINLRVDRVPGGGLRISTPTARGWAAVAKSQPELARAIQEAFVETECAGYSRWRGRQYDLDALTAQVPGDALAGSAPSRPSRRGPRGGEGWRSGQQRPDVHLPSEWAEQPDGRWRSPSGRMYRPDAAQVVRVRARLAKITPPAKAA